ncbi:hypothetical protein SO802_008131 [Lithocarpus litseifolius]|uniref:Isopenicillin N synthase-like Fe(2+) 2OG dioxygenase domain-containing protein n=1 Tax=Lithocarpus litseifolius TaxID=425828 RepID=A0AAW2D8L7_9ROSI
MELCFYSDPHKHIDFFWFRLLKLENINFKASINEEAPEKNPAYATVYVGNLSHEAWTNGRLKSVVHRVVVNKEKQRLFRKPGDVLAAAENYIEEHGTKRSKGSLES